MENERTDVSSSLPTRRSRRVAADAFVDSAHATSVAAPPAPAMTRRALREISAQTPASITQTSAAVAPVPPPASSAPLTRRDMRLSRGIAELAQFNSGSSPVEARRTGAAEPVQSETPQSAPRQVNAPASAVRDAPSRQSVKPRETDGLTRAQLRALQHGAAETTAEQQSVDVLAELPAVPSPVVAAPVAVVQPVAPVPPAPAVSPASPEPADDYLQSILAEVNAVVAQVERRVEAAGRPDAPRGPEPLVLHARAEEPVDSQAPVCDIHRTGDVPRVDVVAGTSIVIPSPSDSLEETHGFAGEAFGLEPTAADEDPFAREIYGASAQGLNPATRVGALSRGTHPVSHGSGHGPRNRWIPRAAVLSTLSLATVGVPLLTGGTGIGFENLASGEGVDLAALKGPSTLAVLKDVGGGETVPSSIALPVTEEERAVLAASRAGERSSLDNCDPSVGYVLDNGNIPQDKLCKVMGYSLNPEAAVALTELNNAFNARFGHDMCLVSGYRSLADQYSVKRSRGSFAASPGLSPHGFGFAVDLCPSSYQAPVKWEWMHENAPKFGWVLPDWASRTYEPWHWEYEKGMKAAGY